MGGECRELFVHRKGATRALVPGYPEMPAALRRASQPVLAGGSMGTGSYVLTACAGNDERSPSWRGLAEEATVPTRT